MELRILRYFLAVAREESITKASEVLHITQPTLSRQLNQLEEETGVTLFNRGSRKISLTNEGILLRRRAEEIISLVDKTEKELMEQEELVDGKISIGCGGLSSVDDLADMIKDFRLKYPLVTFDIITGTADIIKEQTDKGLIDIGLLLEPIEIEKYDFIRFNTKEKMSAIMPVDSPLASKEYITAADLINVPLIMPHRPNIQNELVSWFGSYFDKLNIVYTSNLLPNILYFITKGLGIGIAIEGAVPFVDKNQIKIIPLYPSLELTSVLVWKRHQPFSLAVTKFIDYIYALKA